jgi:hypothetical protein
LYAALRCGKKVASNRARDSGSANGRPSLITEEIGGIGRHIARPLAAGTVSLGCAISLAPIRPHRFLSRIPTAFAVALFPQSLPFNSGE